MESVAFGPKLSDGSFFLLTGIDNDYSVTQNASGLQFDVYFRFTDADPYATSIQCPLGQITGCFATSDGSAANLNAEYSLLPGVLYGYKAPASDFPAFVAPVTVPEATTFSFLLAGLVGLGVRKVLQMPDCPGVAAADLLRMPFISDSTGKPSFQQLWRPSFEAKSERRKRSCEPSIFQG